MSLMRVRLHTAVFVAVAPGAVVLGVPALVIWFSGSGAGDALALIGAVPVLAGGLAIFAWSVADFVTRGRARQTRTGRRQNWS